MSNPSSMLKGDLLILANIYVGILTDAQNKTLYGIINSHNTMGHILGTYPLGMYYVYNFPKIFSDHQHLLRTMKDTDEHLLPVLVILASKHILKTGPLCS